MNKKIIKYYFWNDTLPTGISQIPNNVFPKIEHQSVTYYSDADRCPVVNLYHTNTFTLRSPIDLTFSVDKNFETSSVAVQEIKHANHTIWVNISKSSLFDVEYVLRYLRFMPKNKIEGFLKDEGASVP